MTSVAPRPSEVTLPRLPVAAPSVRPTYKFIKVEDFFKDYQSWYRLDNVTHYEFDDKRSLSLQFQRHDGKTCAMLLQFPRSDTMHVRFNPNNAEISDYTSSTTRSVVMDTVGDQMNLLEKEMSIDFSTHRIGGREILDLITLDKDGNKVMRAAINLRPFRIALWNYDDGKDFLVWQTALPGIYYAPNDDGVDYSIIQAVDKRPTARFIGFGEQGGKELAKNTSQLDYFNYDNMRYMQVYGKGPFEDSEPLYHSDPFFMEFNGVPEKDCVLGVFVDNPSHVCMDVGSLNSGRYMLGTRFGDLNYYLFMGDTSGEVLEAYTSFIGKPQLKPRYILGYHQGCYGYETRADLENAVNEYRKHGIPLDGLHVDVDVQHNYQTFTIDESKFPNPKEMFANLKAKGVKCSTNITPIISNKDENYKTYSEGKKLGYFVTDHRLEPDNPASRWYQDFGGGHEYYQYYGGSDYNSGEPFIGEVYYGQDRITGAQLGTTGHYPDFGREEVRKWWGQQYQYLFDMGLEMVWQDMTTPCIRPTRGDMRGFPFRLLVTDDYFRGDGHKKSPAIRAWNLFSYNLHKATYHGLNNLKGRENKRNFIIGRGSFTGVHRFAGLWTGDNSSSWEFLNINIAQVLAVGLGGIAIAGEDIGGFEREHDWEKWADPELLIRWTCAGAFLPWFRNHYIKKGVKLFQEPYAYDSLDLDAWNIPHDARYLYKSVLPICKHYIELRYRLLQLFYDAMFENMDNGLPICRAMILNDPQDKSLFNDKLKFLDDQFFVRKDLLVAPVLDPQRVGQGKRDVYLPAGPNLYWYSFMDNKRPLLPRIEGGTTVLDFDAHIDASSDHMSFIVPMFVRAGAIIPTLELEQYVGERNAHNLPNPITLNIYPCEQGVTGEYTMFLDDGVSRSSSPDKLLQVSYKKDINTVPENNEFRKTQITHKYTGEKTREIKVERLHDGYTPPLEKYFYVAILHDPEETRGSSGPLRTINVNGRDLHPITDGSAEQRAAALDQAQDNSWYYNENVNISFVKVFDDRRLITLMTHYV